MELAANDLSQIIDLAKTNQKNVMTVVNVQGYGAKGDGTTDDTAAIQAAIDAAKAANSVVYFPSGIYKITATLNSKGVSIQGAGSGVSNLYTEANIPMITYDTDAGQVYYAFIKDLGFIGNVSGTRTSNAGVLITGASGQYFNYNTFENLLFQGVYYGIHSTKTTGGGENKFDWNLFTQLKATNYGVNNVAYGIKFDYGSGTGNVFDALNFVTVTSAIEWGGSGDENIGDISISDCQFGGSGNAIKATKGATGYGSNIAITSCQWDAGIQYGINFTNMNSFRVKACNWGGATAHLLTGCSHYSVEDASDTQSTYGNAKTGIASGASVDLFSLSFPSGIYQSLFVEVVTHGLMQGIGSRMVVSTYMLGWDGTGGTWTLINETATGTTGNKLSHTMTGGNFPKISVVTVGTSGDSDIISQARVIADKYTMTIV